ncbi:EIF4G2, partial [Symbiodinium sp. CCMP2456]
AAFLKKNASQTQWRSIINKFTPEKFDKLCEQLLSTLPVPGAANSGAAEKTSCCDTEFGTVLDELLSLIFDACS